MDVAFMGPRNPELLLVHRLMVLKVYLVLHEVCAPNVMLI
jgi:hypothetical protein